MARSRNFAAVTYSSNGDRPFKFHRTYRSQQEFQQDLFDHLAHDRYDVESIRIFKDGVALNPRRPVVGELATYCIGSDRYAGEVVAVSKSGHKLTFRRRGTRSDRDFYRQANGDYGSRDCGTIGLGYADDYLDPSF